MWPSAGAGSFRKAHFYTAIGDWVDVLRVRHAMLSGSMFGKPTKAAILVTLLFWELEEVVWIWALGRYGCTDPWPQIVCFVVVPGMAGAACDAAPGLVTFVLSLPVVLTPRMFDLRWGATELVVEYLVLYLILWYQC
jgi:hypothetical protein